MQGTKKNSFWHLKISENKSINISLTDKRDIQFFVVDDNKFKNDLNASELKELYIQLSSSLPGKRIYAYDPHSTHSSNVINKGQWKSTSLEKQPTLHPIIKSLTDVNDVQKLNEVCVEFTIKGDKTVFSALIKPSNLDVFVDKSNINTVKVFHQYEVTRKDRNSYGYFTTTYRQLNLEQNLN